MERSGAMARQGRRGCHRRRAGAHSRFAADQPGSVSLSTGRRENAQSPARCGRRRPSARPRHGAADPGGGAPIPGPSQGDAGLRSPDGMADCQPLSRPWRRVGRGPRQCRGDAGAHQGVWGQRSRPRSNSSLTGSSASDRIALPTRGDRPGRRPPDRQAPLCRPPVEENTVMGNRLKFYGWGLENTGLTDAEREHLFHFVAACLGVEPRVAPPPRAADIALSTPRVEPPAALASVLTQEPYERLLHTYGKSYPETVRAFARDFMSAPDLVALPQSEADVAAVLDWASQAKVAVIPFGGDV